MSLSYAPNGDQQEFEAEIVILEAGTNFVIAHETKNVQLRGRVDENQPRTRLFWVCRNLFPDDAHQPSCRSYLGIKSD